jgi:hypothetical protein
MNTKIEFTVKSSIFDRSRQLTIDPEYLEFDDHDLGSSLPVRFLKEEIEGIKYGVKGIRGYRFRIGRIYYIDIKSFSGEVIKVRLKSIYRVRVKRLEAKYGQILKALFANYFNEIARRYLELFRSGEPFEMLGVSFSAEGVLFDEKIGIIPWEFLGTKKYWTYYALFSETNPEHYKAFNYVDQWNAAVLHSVTEGILKMKFPVRQSS